MSEGLKWARELTTWVSGEQALEAEGIANTKALRQESAWYIQGTSRNQSRWSRQTTYIKTVTKHTQICDVCGGNEPLEMECLVHCMTWYVRLTQNSSSPHCLRSTLTLYTTFSMRHPNPKSWPSSNSLHSCLHMVNHCLTHINTCYHLFICVFSF